MCIEKSSTLGGDGEGPDQKAQLQKLRWNICRGRGEEQQSCEESAAAGASGQVLTYVGRVGRTEGTQIMKGLESYTALFDLMHQAENAIGEFYISSQSLGA